MTDDEKKAALSMLDATEALFTLAVKMYDAVAQVAPVDGEAAVVIRAEFRRLRKVVEANEIAPDEFMRRARGLLANALAEAEEAKKQRKEGS